MSETPPPVTARQRVRDVLEGQHPCLVVIGSGCHHHLDAHGVVYPGAARGSALFDWGALLRGVDDSAEPPRHADSTAIWESLVARRCGQDPARSPRDHERALLKRVRETLLPAVPSLGDAALGRFGAAMRGRGLRHVVTLNFDRTLDLALTRGEVQPPVSRPGDEAIGDYRAQLHVDTGDVRVWYAHGMAAPRVRYESIQLGLVGYAESVAALRARYATYRRRRSAWLRDAAPPGSQEDRYWPPGLFSRWAEGVCGEASGWLDPFLTAHVLVVGCGLSQAETDVWYALHARQRELAGLDDAERPQTFYLHPATGFPAHIETGPAGIVPVMTDSHDESWELLLGRWWD